MASYEEHPSRTAALRDGEIEVHPGAAESDCVVWAELEGDEGWEGLLAKRLETRRARVCAIPFRAYDINLDDEVALSLTGEGALLVEGVERDAGNFTYRVVFDDAAVGDPRWHQLLSALGAYECWFDLRDPGYLAISAPPQHAQAVAEELYAREQRGELGYETGRS